MKCLVLYSHDSGKRNFDKRLPLIERKLKAKFSVVNFCCTISESDAKKEAVEACGKYDCLICVGGDGTFNNLVNAIAKQEKKPLLGYLNFGTLGDIGRNFGIGRNLSKALKIITDGYTTPFDVGEINGRFFAYVCTIGRYSDIAYVTPRKRKRRLGRVAYYNKAIGELHNKKTVHAIIDADGGHYEVDTPFLLLLNGRNVGGFKVNSYCDISDGKMELYLAKPDWFNGVYHILSRTKTIIISAKEFHIVTDENMSWCLDGEEGPTGEAHIVTHHNLLTIYAKNPAKKKLR
jgi:diacylglycerol kinase (ATP)